MARPLPVNLLIAGTGGVLLVSGIGGKSIGEVLKGTFGNLKVNPAAKPESEKGEQQNTANMGEGTMQNVSEGGPLATPSPIALTPSPTHKRSYTKAEIAREVAKFLAREGITNPTQAQVNKAYELWRIETGQLVP